MDMTPVLFQNKDGQKLSGIVHEPARVDPELPAILILSPGMKSRVGPHRLYVKMARSFVQMGYRVVRYDFYGLGDSEGNIAEDILAEFYDTIQAGRYVEDAIAAMDWMEKTYGHKRFIMAGLCGGAITGLFAGSQDSRVVGLLGIGIPVNMITKAIDQYKYITEGELQQIMKSRYLKNMRQLNKWKRFLTGQSDYRLILKGISQLIGNALKKKTARRDLPTNDSSDDTRMDNMNKLFPPAMVSMLSQKKRVLLIFSEADRLYWEYKEKYYPIHASQIREYEQYLTTHVVANANHVLSMPDWVNEMLKASSIWLSMSQWSKKALSA